MSRRHIRRKWRKNERSFASAADTGRRIFRGQSLCRALAAVWVGRLCCLALSVVGAMINPHQFSFSWLFAFAFFFTLCAGCLFWTIVHHATDAEWSVVVRRQLENIALLMAVMTIFFVPILILRRHLY